MIRLLRILVGAVAYWYLPVLILLAVIIAAERI